MEKVAEKGQGVGEAGSGEGAEVGKGRMRGRQGGLGSACSSAVCGGRGGGL